MSNARNILSYDGHKYFYDILESLRYLKEKITDFDIIVIYDSRKSYEINLAMKKLNLDDTMMGVQVSDDPFNIAFDS